MTSDPCPLPPNITSSTLEVFTCREGSQLFMGVMGPGTLIQYQDILQELVYSNNAKEPDKNELNKNVSVSTLNITCPHFISICTIILCLSSCYYTLHVVWENYTVRFPQAINVKSIQIIPFVCPPGVCDG